MGLPRYCRRSRWPSFLYLMGLIFWSRVHFGVLSTSQLSISAVSSLDMVQTDPNAYYVRISATTLVLIVSFSSSLAVSLIGFSMAFRTSSLDKCSGSPKRGTLVLCPVHISSTCSSPPLVATSLHNGLGRNIC